MKDEETILDKIIAKLKRLLPDGSPHPDPGSGTDRCKVDRVWVDSALALRGRIQSMVLAVEKEQERILRVLQQKDEQIELQDQVIAKQDQVIAKEALALAEAEAHFDDYKMEVEKKLEDLRVRVSVPLDDTEDKEAAEAKG